ncbi:MAG TPA: threonylcarbamoyl-AMP synthase [Euryarchaeota archaeon]|nr:threonylcarbamoyl-AMP synthase [archaeon BMS3Bbin15]HDL15515.1 threonylcarbamoyl-AMP synthase [Euryarchaeota archaeon]
MTLILKIDTEKPERDKILKAAGFIRKGEVVAFPTETVYGLGADAMNPDAIKKIFRAKRRPLDNPLIIHISRTEQVYRLVEEVPSVAEKLMEAFWPGPLTIILKKSSEVPPEATAGLNTVAIRMPDHKVALQLIEFSSVPIAAPSANLSGRPSPTKAEHVIEDFYSKIACIIDSGRCRIGLESTVMLLTEDKPLILRPGAVTIEEIEKVTGNVEFNNRSKTGAADKPVSPGMKYRHYAPEAELWLVSEDRLEKAVREALKVKKKVGVITRGEKNLQVAEVFNAGTGIEEYASNIFAALRYFDDRGIEIIVAEGVEETGIGVAIMNRLKKAATRMV